jgi:hypothetical protein
MTPTNRNTGTNASRMILIIILEVFALCFVLIQNTQGASRVMLSLATNAPKVKSSSNVSGTITNALQNNSSMETDTELKILPEEDSPDEESSKETGTDRPKVTSPSTEEEDYTQVKNLAEEEPSRKEQLSKDERRIERIVVLGERHSGTSYTAAKLEKCFPGLGVSSVLVRFKHWFQPTPEYVINATARGLDKSMRQIAEDWPKIVKSDNPKTFFNNTLVIVMVRSAYDWIEAMRVGPHHWTNHFHVKRHPNAPITNENGIESWYGSEFLPWTEFVAANMTYLYPYGTGTLAGGLCQQAMPPGAVSPCRISKETYPEEVKKDYASNLDEAPNVLVFGAVGPIYEHDANGKPFQHPLGLRAAKIRNFLDIPNKWDVGGFMTMQFEDMNTKGSAFLLDAVSKIIGVESSCEPDPPKNQAMKQLDRQWTEWITEHADWDTEALVGYKPRPPIAEEIVDAKAKDLRKQKGIEVKNSSEETSKGANIRQEETPDKRSAVATAHEKQPSKDGRRIKRIVVLGERHSGTSYTTSKLSKCFPGLNVSPFLIRFKHWFQPTPEYVVNTTTLGLDRYKEEAGYTSIGSITTEWPKIVKANNPKSFFKNTLVIIMVRSSYDWIEAMRVGPHHWPNHFHVKRFPNATITDENGDKLWYGSEFLPWTKFVAANMTYLYPHGDFSGGLCQQAMPPGTVSPCLVWKETIPEEVKKDYASNMDEVPDQLPFSTKCPIYEHNANGKPFQHPLDFRAAKLRNFLDIPNQWDVGGFMSVQFEDMNSKGSGFLLDVVTKMTGVDPSCEPDPPKRQAMKQLDRQWTEWITEHADWDAEALVGYKPRPKSTEEIQSEK